jgi:pentatricopeptide repeat protein
VLVVKVMVKSGQVGSAWKLYERMERGGFLPNALTFKGLYPMSTSLSHSTKATHIL